MLFFQTPESKILLWLVIVHLLTEFFLQPRQVQHQQKWFSTSLGIYTLLSYLALSLVSGWWLELLGVGAIKYFLSGWKTRQTEQFPDRSFWLFLLVQMIQVLVLYVLWAYQYERLGDLLVISSSLQDPKALLIVIGYLLVTTPVSVMIRYAIQSIPRDRESINPPKEEEVQKRDRSGRMIGIYERIIILTFVLLNEYEAIGFLITGKSIIRFAGKDEQVRSEYVLVGTMMSYALSIGIGVLINLVMARI